MRIEVVIYEYGVKIIVRDADGETVWEEENDSVRLVRAEREYPLTEDWLTTHWNVASATHADVRRFMS